MYRIVAPRRTARSRAGFYSCEEPEPDDILLFDGCVGLVCAAFGGLFDFGMHGASLFAQIAKREGVRALVHGIMAACGLLSIFAWGGTQIAFTVFNVVYAACARKRLRRDI
ncbi:hypothetical protein [Slackia piriformis]|uniref:hypothetical protein n=1 Tax=Slackia piriformis TaxID=626934 RepID=UPI0039F6259A